MLDTCPFWNLSGLTNAALLGGLSRLVGSGRQLLAEVVAHLAEVEERRLHLDSGYGSMFAYCTSRLGLSEDEACRRIEAARIARHHPDIYQLLASGQLSLSVIALLKPYLVETPSPELLELVSGKSSTRARELLAARFPRPDVASRIRKLPVSRGTDEDKVAAAPVLPLSGVCQAHPARTSISPPVVAPPTFCSPGPLSPSHPPPSAPPRSEATAAPSPAPNLGKREVPHIGPASRPRSIEPLSVARYKIQLTADTALKDKLELARDLMRHTVPDGDFAPILSRALDLLIEQLMKRRFGARGKQSAVSRPNHGLTGAQSDGAGITARPPALHSPSSGPSAPSAAPHPESQPPSAEATSPNAPAPAPHPAPVPPLTDAAPEVSRRSKPRAISRSTRRTVAERDGLRCTWQSPDGVRCESRAWLENDHVDPRGRGGGSEPDNVRLLCRAHNQRAAELHYGRSHMVDAITRARKSRSPVPPAP